MKQDGNRGFWQRFAKLYGPAMEKSGDLYETLCEEMLRTLTEEMDVLELACGSGQLSFPLAGSVHRWEATDFSPAMVAEAQKRPGPPQLHFSVEDATALPYPDGSFDAVVIANALHIMPHPEQALAEIRRVLKPDGVLFAPTFLNGAGWKFHLRSGIMKLGGFHVYSPWSQGAFVDYVEDHGFWATVCHLVGPDWMPLCYLEAQPDEEP